jgi:hypothetical protein
MQLFNKAIREEYYNLIYTNPDIALVCMVKNEEDSISTTLNSVKNTVKALIIYDTGSTDKTIDIIKNFSKQNKINLYLLEGTFVDFTISRNILLDFCETVNIHYLLLLDSCDELKGGENLLKFAKRMIVENNSGFLVLQNWWTGQRNDKYYNVRFVKNREGWRYSGSVHEYISDKKSNSSEPRFPIIRLDDNIILYQDRTKDSHKSFLRFTRDKELLYKDHLENPKESRTLFYLAQTCQCLDQLEECIFYSKLRLKEQGFFEERFHSLIRIGDCLEKLNYDWKDILPWYIQAFDEFERAEPLIRIAEHYIKDNKLKSAYMYLKQASDLEYPTQLILFVDFDSYNYKRWHLLGIVCFYLNKLHEGKEACLKAIKAENRDIDKNNLEFYKKAIKSK